MSETSSWPDTLPQFKQERRSEVMPHPEGIEMESGRLRMRPQHTSPLEMVDVQWTFTEDQYEAFETYFHTDLANGSLPWEQVSFLPSDYHGLVLEVTQVYAFLDSNYQFSRADNEFNVMATLLVDATGEARTTRLMLNPTSSGDYPDWPAPPVELTQSECGEIITITWGEVPGIENFALECSTDQVDWVTYKGNIRGSATHIKLHDPYGVISYYRVVASTADFQEGVSAVVEAAAPHVAPCQLYVYGCTLMPHEGANMMRGSRTVMISPVSSYENDRTAFDEVYMQIQARYDCYWPSLNTGGPTTILDASCTTPGATALWATDGQAPTIEGPNDHTLPHEFGFGCIIKARAYKDGCYGPLTVMYIDQRINILDQCGTAGVGGAATHSNSCTKYSYFPIPDGLGGTTCFRIVIEMGDSFILNGGDHSKGSVLEQVAAMFAAHPPELATSVTQKIFSGTHSVLGGQDGHGMNTVDQGAGGQGAGPCYADWQADPIVCAASTFRAEVCYFDRASVWDQMQSDLTQLRCYLATPLAARYGRLLGFAGPGGTEYQVQPALQGDMDFQQAAICQTPGTLKCYMWTGDYSLEASNIIMTRDDDSEVAFYYPF